MEAPAEAADDHHTWSISVSCITSRNVCLKQRCGQAVKNYSEAARQVADTDRAQQERKHQQTLERESISEQLHEWVADMRAAGLRHCDPSLTALIQVHLFFLPGQAPCICCKPSPLPSRCTSCSCVTKPHACVANLPLMIELHLQYRVELSCSAWRECFLCSSQCLLPSAGDA